jgi:hypothetical protein
MKEVWPSILFAFPFTVYVGVKVLGSVPGSDAGFGGMFVTMFLLAVLAAVPNDRLLLWASGAQMAATLSILLALYFAFDFGVDLLAGSLLAAPALLMSYSVRPGPLGWRLLGFALALTIGLTALATNFALTGGHVVVTGGEFVREFVFLIITQIQGIYAILTGVAGSLPLRDFFDPDYVVFGAIAVAGLLLTSLRPQTAWGDLLPAAGSPGEAGPDPDAALPDLGPDLSAALAGRSWPEPAPPVPPGVPALLGGCMAALLAVAAAYVNPGATLVLIASGIVVFFGFTIAVMRRTLPARP